MATIERLQNFLNLNYGYITTKEANHIGFSNERLRLLVKAGILEKADFGIYMSPDNFLDQMYVLQKSKSKIIYSHETALYLHDLTDRNPVDYYYVTVPTNYKIRNAEKVGLKPYSIKRELHDLGVTKAETILGNEVAVYNIERTICDCMRSRSKMDIAILTDAVKQYVKRKDKDLYSLTKMAEIFGITKPLQHYLEVLL